MSCVCGWGVWVCVCVCKRRWMRVSATPATLLFLLACQLLPHDTGADKRRRSKHRATNPGQARHTVPWVPRLPRKTTVDVSCVPRLPRETKVNVTKCHACHAKCRGAPGDKSGPSAPHSTMSATPATQNDAGCELCATPATWNEGECHQVPRLPRKMPRRPGRQIRAKRATQYHECHACHAKRCWMWVVCHACHVKRGWMSPSATPATHATQKCRGAPGDKSGPSAPHSTMSATPATQNDAGCELCATPATWNEGECVVD